MENLEYPSLLQEVKFGLEELFFSITKTDSVILSGNETFMRICGYKRAEIMGQHHNIIRHADMPSVVFKTFWDFLKAGKSVATYVKNRTKDGGYYWVFAVVFPLRDYYISIRIKPNTKIFSSVKEIYSQLLAAQESLDMQESEQLFLDILNGLLYRDYEHFMKEALVAELLMRKKLFLELEVKDDYLFVKSASASNIQRLYCSSQELLKEYKNWFEKIEEFSKIKSLFEEKSFVLSSLARDIVFLSLNASVASYRVDTRTETFGVLASDIRLNAKENESLIAEIYTLSQLLSESLDKNIFLVSSISLQMEMAVYFIRELLEKHTDEFTQNVLLLFELVNHYNEKLCESVLEIDKTIVKCTTHFDKLDKQIMYLGYIQIYGVIESARINDDASGFGEIFLQLKSQISNMTKEVLYMKDIAEKFFIKNRVLISESKCNEKMLIKLKDEIAHIKNIKD